MYGLQNGEQALHKEAALRRVERDEEDIKKIKGCFSPGLMIDMFIYDSDVLIIIPTRVVLPHLICSQALFCEPHQTLSLSAFFLPFISAVKAVKIKKNVAQNPAHSAEKGRLQIPSSRSTLTKLTATL